MCCDILFCRSIEPVDSNTLSTTCILDEVKTLEKLHLANQDEDSVQLS